VAEAIKRLPEQQRITVTMAAAGGLTSAEIATALDVPAGTVRYRLHGRHFKGVRDADGTPAPDGAARQWTVIPPVHTAVSILE